MCEMCFPSTYHPSMRHLRVHGVLEVKSIWLQQLGSHGLSQIDCLKFLAPSGESSHWIWRILVRFNKHVFAHFLPKPPPDFLGEMIFFFFFQTSTIMSKHTCSALHVWFTFHAFCSLGYLIYYYAKIMLSL